MPGQIQIQHPMAAAGAGRVRFFQTSVEMHMTADQGSGHLGERDGQVIELNERAMARMRAPVRLVIIPGATHLFEEPGALERVARLAREWFVHHLVEARRGAGRAP